MSIVHVVALLAVTTAAAVGATPPGQPSPSPPPPPVEYRAPVDAPVLDPYREPASPYAAGNRGIDYGTASGDPVRAAGAGTVVFAGPVAGSLHVTILHPDGLRTSYSFLATVAVAVGAAVPGGAVVGVAGGPIHFGVRAGDDYLDPARVIGGTFESTVHLVPVGAGPLATGPDLAERDALAAVAIGGTRPVDPLALAATVLSAAPALIEPADDAASHLRSEARLTPHALRLVGATGRWLASTRSCTDPTTVPPAPGERRVVVLVGGLGSSSGGSSGIGRLDTTALGYDPGDVVQFSYAGGRTPRSGAAFATVPSSSYGPADTGADLTRSGARLADLLTEVAAAAPGVPIDVVAHSQGGVVARLALLDLEAAGALPAEVGLLATIATPHAGADLATGAVALRDSWRGAALLAAASASPALPVEPTAVAVAQLSETSDLVGDLTRWGTPNGVAVVSIAARGDLVVPVARTVVAGEDHVVVPLTGPEVHDALPASPAVVRAVTLARAGWPPDCRALGDALLDASAGEAIAAAEDLVSLALHRAVTGG